MSEPTVIALTAEQATEIFQKAELVESYDIREDDLVKLANAFVTAVAPEIIKAERDECIKFTKSLNGLVGNALKEKRESL